MKHSNVKEFHIRKIVKYFCEGNTASSTAVLTGMNRKTINRFYMIFRILIKEEQEQLFYRKFDRPITQLDRGCEVRITKVNINKKDYYFSLCYMGEGSAWSNYFSPAFEKMVSDFNSLQRGASDYNLLLRECEWRFGCSVEYLETDLNEKMFKSGHFLECNLQRLEKACISDPLAPSDLPVIENKKESKIMYQQLLQSKFKKVRKSDLEYVSGKIFKNMSYEEAQVLVEKLSEQQVTEFVKDWRKEVEREVNKGIAEYRKKTSKNAGLD